MPRLKKITFFQYKNYLLQSFAFNANIICIYGANGSGKTNVLDAIYFLAYTKSYFSKKNYQMVTNLKSGMFIEADFLMDDEINKNIKIIIRETDKKEIWENKEEVKQLQNHIGKIPCIMIAPDDTVLITEGSEHRRKFIDGIICQYDTIYFNHLINYNKHILQRNALLKNWWEAGNDKQELLQYYNTQLCIAAKYIFDARKLMIQELAPIVENLYLRIGDENENVKIIYDSKLIYSDLESLFKESLNKDIALKRTTCGIHRDDVLLQLNDEMLFKDYASQGQKKTLLFALKIAQYNFLKSKLNITPILLLDDVFEKLDSNRSNHLLNLITNENCQTFITDTHLERLQIAFKNNKNDVQYLEIK